MCNIAGYVGTEPAAPILLDLIERQEGLAGGFYTGIATIHEGKLHWRKVIGDLARLRDETGADDLPGTIGLAHSRSNSGGDWRWSHPFVACDDTVAYIANGSQGYFEGKVDNSVAARRMEAEGHVYTAVADEQVSKYPALDDGRSVHMSDVMAHAIEANLKAGVAPDEAICKAFLDLPSEIVGLFITPAQPDSIFGTRYTMPMCVAIDERGARIASSPTGFGERPEWWMWVPPFSTATVSATELQVRPFDCPEGPLVDDINRGRAREIILDELAKGEPLGVGPLLNAVKELSARKELVVRYDPVYDVLLDLLEEGRIEQRSAHVKGAEEDAPGTRFTFALAD